MMLKNLNPRQHVTPLVLLFLSLVIAACRNFIQPDDGWGYIAGFTFGIFGLILLSVHIILFLLTSNRKIIWTIETAIALLCIVYGIFSGILG